MAAILPRPSEPDDPTPAELLAARPAFSMHAMDGLLLEDVPLNAVADAVGTPAWVLSAGTIRSRLAALRRALDDAGLPARVHYAVKANDHLAVLRLVARGGAGADVVSAGELRRARLAGWWVVLAGVLALVSDFSPTSWNTVLWSLFATAVMVVLARAVAAPEAR